MKYLLVLVSLTCLVAQASVVANFSTDPSVTFEITSVTEVGTEANMAGGLEITAMFSNATSASCPWADVGAGSANCVSLNNFSVSLPNDLNTHPAVNASPTWTITNLHSSANITSVTFDGLAGFGFGVAFDRCISAFGGFNDTDPVSNCIFGQAGTPGSDIGYTMNDGAGGSAGITGDVEYSRNLALTAAAPVGDLWGVANIDFSGSSTAFAPSKTFTFLADTDLIEFGLPPQEIPEPSTWLLMGLGVAALGLWSRRHRRASPPLP